MTPGQRERIGQLLDEMAADAGPIPADMLDEARQLWRPSGHPARSTEEAAE